MPNRYPFVLTNFLAVALFVGPTAIAQGDDPYLEDLASARSQALKGKYPKRVRCTN